MWDSSYRIGLKERVLLGQDQRTSQEGGKITHLWRNTELDYIIDNIL